jgi:hypothetical protein
LKNKNGGKCPLTNYDMQVLRVAERYHLSPDNAEEMSEYWFNRTLLLMVAESQAAKLK